MVVRKKRRYRKPYYPLRETSVRNAIKLSNKVHSFKLHGTPLITSLAGCGLGGTGTLTLTAANVAGQFSFGFTLQDVTDYANFTAIYDQYRLQAVKIKMMPKHNSFPAFQSAQVSTTSAIQTSNIGRILTVVDYDDASSLASVAAARDYESCHEDECYRTIHRYFKPRMASAAYSGAFTSYTAERGKWMDSASPGVQYYGFKGWITGTGSANDVAPAWDLVVTYYLQFRFTH